MCVCSVSCNDETLIFLASLLQRVITKLKVNKIYLQYICALYGKANLFCLADGLHNKTLHLQYNLYFISFPSPPILLIPVLLSPFLLSALLFLRLQEKKKVERERWENESLPLELGCPPLIPFVHATIMGRSIWQSAEKSWYIPKACM